MPAGILYQTALGKYHSSERTQGDSYLETQKDKHYKMSGLILEDRAVIRAMESEEQGIFIPVKEGQTATEALASLAEMGKLKTIIEEKICNMADSLCDGKIGAVPTVKNTSSPCSYCEYRVVCGFEEGDEVMTAVKLHRNEVLKEVERYGN